MIRWLSVAFLVFAALPAAATTDGWPALYDVVGVAADDALNVRSGPGTEHEIIGTLPYDAEDIEIVRPSEDLDWGLLNFGEATGWISLNFAVPQPGQWYGSIPKITQCFGTEPFWSIERSLELLRFRNQDGLNIAVDEAYFIESRNRRDRFIASGSSVVNGLTLVVSNQTCSDGMSDRDYGLSVDVLVEDAFDAQLYSGCCSIAPLSE